MNLLPYTPKLFTELRNYRLETFSKDLFAGLTVGVVALPLAMAFAIASGLPPERGLFTAVVAGFLISLLGGSRVQIGGPTGAFVIIVSGIVARYGYSGLAVCTAMAAVLLILMGLFNLGTLIKFIPFPVTTGFTTGIALTIFSTQIRDLLGLRMESVPAEFLEKWDDYLHALPTLNPAAAGISLLTILLIVFTRRLAPRLPAMLVAMAAATLLASLLHLDVETIGSRFGDLPRVLPRPALPSFDPALIRTLAGPALTVALLAAIESLLSATVADGMTGGRHRPNAELIAQGLANFGSVLFGGIPATGAIARTATNVKSGARTPVAGIIHALTLALILLLFAPLAKQIPLAALGGILAVVSWNMSELHHFRRILKGPRSDALVLILTFLLTVLVDLTVAVQFGVVFSALLFMRRMADISEVARHVPGTDEHESAEIQTLLEQLPPHVEVFEVRGSFFFGMIDRFHTAILTLESTPAILILRVADVWALDATAIHALRETLHLLRKEGTRLMICDLRAQPLLALERSGFLDELGPENLPGSLEEAVALCKKLHP